MKRIAVIEQYAGIGDGVHLEPVLRHILASGYDEIHVFYREDAVGIYREYPDVYDHPLEAKQLMLSLCREGAAHVSVGDDEHQIPGVHRGFQYANKICPALGIPLMEGEYPETPHLPVTQQEHEWGRGYFRAAEGQLRVLFQADSYRTSKSLIIIKAQHILSALTAIGAIALICNDFMKYRRDGTMRHVKGLNIRQLMSVASGADVTLSMDSAPGWLSLAVGTYTVMLFGATHPNYFAYKDPKLNVLLNVLSPCLFCNLIKCGHRICLSSIDTPWIIENMKGGKHIPMNYPTGSIIYPSALQRNYVKRDRNNEK